MKSLGKTNCRFHILLPLLIILMGLTSYHAQAQSMGISSSAITPDASSILELRTTTKGMLIPRMTTTERNAISSPATGLMIYNTTTSNFNFYNGSSWTSIFSGSSGVNSVSGTSNRISIGGTSADPTIDISSSYVGQSSITTLGTIGTGVWNGTIITSGYGGTGNGFTKFTGPATSEKTFTLPNASATILTDNAAVTVAQGGTGVATLASNGVLYGNGTGAVQALPVNSSGTVQYLSQVSSGAPTWVTPTNGTVTSVSGTTNRITVATGTTTPVIDISSSYVGQSSITTLGTIGTGTWNGSLVTGTYGGTGVNNGSSTITLGGNLITSGAFATTLTSTATTNATLPAGTNTLYSTKAASITSAQLLASLSDPTGTGVAVFGTTPTLATPVINGLATGTGVASAATASTLASRDANANLSANNHIQGYTTTATAAGTTTLTVGSTYLQFFTGSTTQTVTMPVTSTLVLGQQYIINNLSSGAVTVQSSGSNTIQAMGANTQLVLTVISTSGTGTSSWSWTYNSLTNGGSAITALTGDVTATGPGSVAATLATVNSNTGSFGSSTAIPGFTVNGKGLITAASTNAVIAPAGTLTGTTLASNVVSSSLTSLGTIGTGVWNGTIITSGYGGTGNGFTKFTGPATSEKTFTLPNASATILTDNAAVTAAQGGTGIASYTTGDILYASGSTTLSKLADIATGNVLISGGVSTAPSWGKVDLTTHVTGILPVANGGTGTSTALTLGSVVFAGASGVLSQNNSKIFWDNTNFRLGIGTASPNTALQVGAIGGGSDGILVGGTASVGVMVNTTGSDFGTLYTTAANTIGIGYSATVAVPSRAVFKVNKTGAATFGTSVSTDDNIIIQPYTGGSNLFAGTITSADLTAARTYTFPDATGTVAVSASGNVALSAAGDIGLTGIIGSTNGGTGNGFTKFSGPATSEKTFTLPNASATILTDNAAVTAAQGGTGQSSYTTGDMLYASSSSALSKLAAVAAGSYLRSAGTSTAPVWSTTTLPNSATTGDLLYGSASNTYSNLADVATGNALISGGTSTAPSWGKIALTTHVSGTLPIANGGTNSTATPTNGGIAYGDGSAYQVTAAGTSGQVLKSGGAGAPTWDAAVTIVALGSDVVNNNSTANTIADVTGLSFSVTSGVTYNFHALIFYTSAATSTGSRWSINGPASPTLLAYTSQNTLAATTVTNSNASAYDIPAASNASCASTAGNIATIDGIIKPSANGTVIVRFASEIASSAITAKAGSTLTWW